MQMRKVGQYPEKRLVAEFVAALRRGSVLVAGTDTVYGLLADATNARAVARIFRMKGRGKKALPIFVPTVAAAKRIAKIPRRYEPILKTWWPGAVTAVFPARRNTLPDIVLQGSNSVALRVPDAPLLRTLMTLFHRPLTGTSANISGKAPARSGKEAWRVFSKLPKHRQPDMILDSGQRRHKPSTIVDFTAARPVIIRRGAGAKSIPRALRALA